MNHRLQADIKQVGPLARAVVARRAAIGTGLGLFLAFLVQTHVVPQPWDGTVMHWVNFGFDTLSVALAAGGIIFAHRAATPADPQLGPKDKYGNNLVSELSVGPHAGSDGTLPPAPDTTDALEAANAIHPIQALQPSDQHTPETPSG